MARYDAEWGRSRFGGGYDRPYGGGRGWGGGWAETERFGPFRGGGYGGDYGGGRGWGGGAESPGAFAEGEMDMERSGLYGPVRYGLGPYHQRLQSRRRPDDELKEDVEEALFYDTWVDAEAITVEAKDGVVTLRGELPEYEEIRYAIDDAWDVDGVRGVRSELTVRERGR